MNKIQRARILKLAAFIAGPVAKADAKARKKGRYKFDMGSWCEWNNWDVERQEYLPRKIGLTRNLCDTSACALGWATVVFPRHLQLDNGVVSLRGTKKFSDLAAMNFFGLTIEQSRVAFSNGTSRSAKEEAALLRGMAQASNGPPPADEGGV